jgi:hypothetical protein
VKRPYPHHRRLSRAYTVRLTPHEAVALERVADDLGISSAAVLRHALRLVVTARERGWTSLAEAVKDAS